MARTRTDEELAAAERAHAGDAERADLLGRARRFKASWIELGEALAKVRQGGAWKRWGFDSFEDYAHKELHLRGETAEKLTSSFHFLQKRAPEVLERDGLSAPIPSYQSVDFLRRAEEQEAAPEEAVSEIRRRVIDDAAPLPALTRKYREVVFPLGEDEQRAKETAALRSAARRLADLLASSPAVPRRLAREVSGAVEQLLAALDEESAAAA
jgi:hypothetical protein